MPTVATALRSRVASRFSHGAQRLTCARHPSTLAPVLDNSCNVCVRREDNSRGKSVYKLGHMVEGREVEHSYPAIFRLPTADSPYSRILVGVPNSDPNVLLKLARCIDGPFFLLYILHTPRGEADEGRYQSPKLTFDDLASFIEDFRPFLSKDGRFDLWVHSPSSKATLAWDRHNLLYAYGPLECYEATLRAEGFMPGEPTEPAPHAHYYHAELDDLAAKVIARFDWVKTPLREEDEQ